MADRLTGKWPGSANAFDGVTWTAITSAVGLLQVPLAWFRALLLKNVEFDLRSIAKGGSFLFFATALIASLVLDFYYSNYKADLRGLSSKTRGFLFFLVPCVIIITTTICFSTSQTQAPQDLNEDVLIAVNYSTLLISVVYAAIIKSLMFGKGKPGGRRRQDTR